MNSPDPARQMRKRSPEELARLLSLIVITDPAAKIGTVPATIAAIEAGAPSIQLRWKDGDAREIAELARQLCEHTHRAGSLLFINDRVDIALAVGADGVHLGDDDLPVDAVRGIVPDGFIVGKSVDTPEEAQDAVAAGANYVGAGPIFATTSKGDTGPVLGLGGLERFRACALPVVGIGGITTTDARHVVEAGATGVAVIGEVMFSDDPGAATRGILTELTSGSAKG